MLSEIKHKVKKIVADKLNSDVSELNETVTLDDLGADDVDVIMMCMVIEKAFRIELSVTDVTVTSTLNDFYNVVLEKITVNTQPPTNEGI